jgi:hypothetical protein
MLLHLGTIQQRIFLVTIVICLAVSDAFLAVKEPTPGLRSKSSDWSRMRARRDDVISMLQTGGARQQVPKAVVAQISTHFLPGGKGGGGGGGRRRRRGERRCRETWAELRARKPFDGESQGDDLWSGDFWDRLFTFGEENSDLEPDEGWQMHPWASGGGPRCEATDAGKVSNVDQAGDGISPGQVIRNKKADASAIGWQKRGEELEKGRAMSEEGNYYDEMWGKCASQAQHRQRNENRSGEVHSGVDQLMLWGEDAEASGVAGMTLAESEHTDFLDFVIMCADAGRATILEHLGLRSGRAIVKGALSNVVSRLIKRYYPGMPFLYADACDYKGIALVITLSEWIDSLDDDIATHFQHLGGLSFSLSLMEDGENRIKVVDQPLSRER